MSRGRISYRIPVGGGQAGALHKLGNDLVGMNVDLIVALATPHARAAQQATRTIPIVVS